MSMLGNFFGIRLSGAKAYKAGCSKLSNKQGFILRAKEPLLVEPRWDFMDKERWFSRLFKHDLWPIKCKSCLPRLKDSWDWWNRWHLDVAEASLIIRIRQRCYTYYSKSTEVYTSPCGRIEGIKKGVHSNRGFETGLYWQYMYFYYNIGCIATSGQNRYTLLSLVGCHYHQIHTFKPHIGF
jgi:hypothetical protein